MQTISLSPLRFLAVLAAIISLASLTTIWDFPHQVVQAASLIVTNTDDGTVDNTIATVTNAVGPLHLASRSNVMPWGITP